MTTLGWVFLPAVLTIALVLYVLALLVAAWVVMAIWRGLRFRVARRFRRVRVPVDGAALNHAETCEWTGFLHGWEQSAPEPTYETGEQS